MHTTHLRKVGGSVMLSIPPALLDVLNLSAGTVVGLSVEDGQLRVQAAPPPKYTLEELLAQCDAQAERSPEDQAWLEDSPVGSELL